jgi:uncharacterized protein
MLRGFLKNKFPKNTTIKDFLRLKEVSQGDVYSTSALLTFEATYFNVTSGMVFDSYALIELALGVNKKNCDVVEGYLNKIGDDFSVYLNEINLGEIYYLIAKKRNEKLAQETLDMILKSSIKTVPIDQKFIINASKIKAIYHVSFADAFCIQTALTFNAPILTRDREFYNVPGIEIIRLGE